MHPTHELVQRLIRFDVIADLADQNLLLVIESVQLTGAVTLQGSQTAIETVL